MNERDAICRECREGKHKACDDTAWDNELDEACDCACAEVGHGQE